MSIQRTASVLVAACVFAALLASGDTGKSVSVNGYVLDSACAFTKGLKKPISAQCAAGMRSGWVPAGDLVGQRNDLLADCRHHAVGGSE